MRIYKTISLACQEMAKYKLACKECRSAWGCNYDSKSSDNKSKYSKEEREAFNKKRKLDESAKNGASQGSRDRAPAIAEDKSKDQAAQQKPKCAQCGKTHGGICQGDQYKRKKGKDKKLGERLLLASMNLVNKNPGTDTTTVPATLTFRNESFLYF